MHGCSLVGASFSVLTPMVVWQDVPVSLSVVRGLSWRVCGCWQGSHRGSNAGRVAAHQAVVCVVGWRPRPARLLSSRLWWRESRHRPHRLSALRHSFTASWRSVCLILTALKWPVLCRLRCKTWVRDSASVLLSACSICLCVVLATESHHEGRESVMKACAQCGWCPYIKCLELPSTVSTVGCMMGRSLDLYKHAPGILCYHFCVRILSDLVGGCVSVLIDRCNIGVLVWDHNAVDWQVQCWCSCLAMMRS